MPVLEFHDPDYIVNPIVHEFGKLYPSFPGCLIRPAELHVLLQDQDGSLQPSILSLRFQQERVLLCCLTEQPEP